MLRGRALATGTMLSVAGASCSLGTSLAGFSGGPSDAGSEATATVPSSSSSSSPDAGPLPPPTEAGTSFCAGLSPAPSFCADFDEGGPPDRGWRDVTLSEGGALSLDGTVLRASTPATSSATTATAFLHHPLDVAGHLLHVEAKLRPTKLGATLTPLALVQTGASYRGLILYVDPGKASLQEETTVGGPLLTSVHQLPAAPPLGEWHRYAFDLDFGASGTTVTVTVDSAVGVDHQPLQYPWTKTGIDVQVGLVYLLTKDAAEYEVDDVVVTIN